jgi:hypothetical protein
VSRLLVTHDRELAEVDTQMVFWNTVGDHALEQLARMSSSVQERGLDIDLGEFGLAVGAQVFVAETLGDLVVTIEAGHHQQLLEQLGRLGQGKEGWPSCTRLGTR